MNIVDRFTNAALGAAATEAPFTGRQINTAPWNGYLEVGVGGTLGLTFDLIIAGQAVAVGVPAQVLAAYPAVPAQLDIQDEKVWATSVIELRVNNPTAGPLPYWAYIRLSDEKRGV